jgi:hypothetical protein
MLSVVKLNVSMLINVALIETICIMSHNNIDCVKKLECSRIS